MMLEFQVPHQDFEIPVLTGNGKSYVQSSFALPSYTNMPSVSNRQLECLRQVGNLEHWCTARHNQGSLHNVGVSCTYRTKNPLYLKNRILSALNEVIKQHPILSAIPTNETTRSPRFVRLPHIDLEKVFKRVYRRERYVGTGRDSELDELLEKTLNIPFPRNDQDLLPFWRVYLLSSHVDPNEIVVTFIFDHGLADGMSGVIFHETFQSAMGETWTPIQDLQVPPSATPLLPSLEAIHELANVREPRFDLNAGLWSGSVMQTPIIGRYRSTVFDQSATARFVRLCRARQTTVTATLQVLLAVALFRSIPSLCTILRCLTQVNLRPCLPQPITHKSMGVLIDHVDEVYHREDLPSFSWSDARAARQTITDYLSANGKHMNAGILKRVPDLNSAMLSLHGQRRTYSFDVSNMGFIGPRMQAAAQDSNWASGRMVFSQSSSLSSAALGCSLVTGPDGCLVLGYTWQSGIVEDAVVEGVVEMVERQILQLIQ